ncbi:MAG TPA: metal-dependent hydrolase [Hyphomicrobiaceae bacterium]|jgi:L-ascorbate metabolism protein UlaG (beta-lactamase superfamily)|nr:metal-dependent hydrolase [Hyphomicrobiaceae bacterium]
MNITWFGHSCFRLETGSSVILIDPFLKGNPTFEKAGIAWEEATKGVTHVALTHGHSDHVGDAAEICKTRGAALFANFELAMYLKSKGAEKLEPMNTGGTVPAADFELTLTNALHSSSTDTYLGNPNGIIIRPKDGKTLYHMGDTDMFGGMALIEEFHKPAIGIVPIGDRFTMGARSAAFTCKKFFKFDMILPCHYGTFPGLLDPTADKFVAEMKDQNVVVPKVGQVLTV